MYDDGSCLFTSFSLHRSATYDGMLLFYPTVDMHNSCSDGQTLSTPQTSQHDWTVSFVTFCQDGRRDQITRFNRYAAVAREDG